MDTPIRMPFLERRKDNLHIQKPVQPNGGTAFQARSFVFLSGGVLVPCATAATLCYGWAPDSSKASTDQPPVTLYGQNHWPFDPKDCQFVVNVSDAAAHQGQAAGAPQLSAVAVGGEYGLVRNGTTGIQMLDSSNTTQKFFRVIAYYPNQALTDYNGLVLVQLVDAVIQA